MTAKKELIPKRETNEPVPSKFEIIKSHCNTSSKNLQISEISAKTPNELLNSQKSFKKLLETKRSKTSSYTQLNKMKQFSKIKICSIKKINDEESESARSEIEANHSQPQNTVPMRNSVVSRNKKVKQPASIGKKHSKNQGRGVHQSGVFIGRKGRGQDGGDKKPPGIKAQKSNPIFSKECTPSKEKFSEITLLNERSDDHIGEFLFLDMFQGGKQKTNLEKVFPEYDWADFNRKNLVNSGSYFGATDTAGDKHLFQPDLRKEKPTLPKNLKTLDLEQDVASKIINANRIDLGTVQKEKHELGPFYFGLSRSIFGNNTIHSYKA